MSALESHDFAVLRNVLYTAVVADVLDALGLRDQVIGVSLPPVSGEGALVGRAKTTLWEDVEGLDPAPYELELKAVDEIQQHEVLIAAAAGSERSGIWGELLSTAARHRGCAGAIVDGGVRDIAKMRETGFHVFARSVNARDSLHRQRVSAVDVPVVVGGVTIAPGDWIVADADGVVVVPRSVAEEAIGKAREKVLAENHVRDEIRAGVPATEVFKKYGVL